MSRLLHDRSRGQSIVEFALILPIFVLVLVGIFDAGRAVFAYNTINNAAREAGRLAILDQNVADIQAEGAEQAVSLGIDPSSILVDFRDPGSPDVVNSCAYGPGDALIVGCLAVVRVPYTYTAATPVVGQLLGTIAMTGETRFRVETACPTPSISSCPIGD
jgi:Flp pilus assembly protein TadG